MKNFARILVYAGAVLLVMPLWGLAADLQGVVYLNFESGVSSALGPDTDLPNLVDASLGNTLIFGAGAGYQVFERLRADFTVSYRGGFEQSVEFGDALRGKADFQSTAAMASLLYEFSQTGGITPYVGGGFGYVYNHLDQVTITDSQSRPVAIINGGGWTNFGVQLTGGITLPLQNDWFVDLGYRYFDGGKYESDDVIHTAPGVNLDFSRHVGDLRAHELTVGLRIPLN